MSATPEREQAEALKRLEESLRDGGPLPRISDVKWLVGRERELTWTLADVCTSLEEAAKGWSDDNPYERVAALGRKVLAGGGRTLTDESVPS